MHATLGGAIFYRLFLQVQADGVDAIAQVGGGIVALTLKDVPQVRFAVGTQNLYAAHAERIVFALNDFVPCEWGEKGRPAAVGLKLLCRAEKLRSTRAARIDPLGGGIGVLAYVGRLGAGFAQDVVFLGA